MTQHDYHLETLAVQAGQEIDRQTYARAVPVYRTTGYSFENARHGADLFGLRRPGNVYARLMNPTNDVLEKRLAAMEGGVAGLSMASGTAAIYFAITNVARQGDEIVSAPNVYGGTFTMFDAILPQQGITVRFAPLNDFAAVEAAINGKTRLVYVETEGNPALDVADIEGYAKIAHRHHLPLFVDSTFSTPALLRPIGFGADVVLHSLSKWIGGHGGGIGGAVVDAGTFDWSDPKFVLFNEPDRGYHGLRFAHDLGANQAAAFALRLRVVGLRNQGATLSPDAAWIFLQGLESLPVRMARHSSNALAVAKFLAAHPKVASVRYPGLPGDPSHALARKYLPDGQGGMVVFEVKGGHDAGVKLVDSIDLFSIIANVGDAKSLIIHPASTTHSQLSPEAQRACGVTPGLVRLSIGIEHVDDIIGALADALEKV